MPSRPKTTCLRQGCPNLVETGYCTLHRKQETKHRESFRGSAQERGYTWEWQKARKFFLLRNPLCVICERAGYVTPANEVDHVIPHRGNRDLFWDRNNWQALCKPCHSRKTLGGE